MEISPIFVDAIRVLHLFCFAAGMGIAVFFDWRAIRASHVQISQDDLGVLSDIHAWIKMAFAGLWVTGIMLIYIRTGFELSNFTPKLVTKLAVMTLMLLNVQAIARYVLPIFGDNVGRSMFELPYAKLATMSQCAINSIFFWFAGLTLGSSAVLKTQGWDVLLPMILGGFLVCTLGGQFMMLVMFVWHRLRMSPALKNA